MCCVIYNVDTHELTSLHAVTQVLANEDIQV